METGPEKPIKTVPVRETGLQERPESPDIKDVILISPVFILSFRTFYSTKAGKEAAKGTAPSRSNGPHSHQSSQQQAVRFADKRKVWLRTGPTQTRIKNPKADSVTKSCSSQRSQIMPRGVPRRAHSPRPRLRGEARAGQAGRCLVPPAASCVEKRLKGKTSEEEGKIKTRQVAGQGASVSQPLPSNNSVLRTLGGGGDNQNMSFDQVIPFLEKQNKNSPIKTMNKLQMSATLLQGAAPSALTSRQRQGRSAG